MLEFRHGLDNITSFIKTIISSQNPTRTYATILYHYYILQAAILKGHTNIVECIQIACTGSSISNILMWDQMELDLSGM